MPMNLRHIRTIWTKEMLDTVRDRRTLFAMIIIPLVLMPIVTVGLPMLMGRQESAAQKTASSIAVIGGENSPRLVEEIKGSDELAIVKSVGDPLSALKDGDIHLVVEIPEGFDQELASGHRPGVKIYFDGTRKASDLARARFMGIFSAFTQKLVAQNLIARGVDPALLSPATVVPENVASKEKMGGFILAMMLPLLIAVWAAVGGMYTAIDVAAGEKERGTLEPLIITPPSRRSIVFGKYLAVLTVATITVILVVTSIMLSLKFAGPTMLGGSEEAKFVLPASSAAIMLGVAFLLAGFIGALEIAISIFAKSFKEAQNYVTPLYILVMIPGFITQFSSMSGAGTAPLSYFAIPVANALEIFKELLMGVVNWAHIGLTAATSFAYVIIALAIATHMFSREDVLFRS